MTSNSSRPAYVVASRGTGPFTGGPGDRRRAIPAASFIVLALLLLVPPASGAIVNWEFSLQDNLGPFAIGATVVFKVSMTGGPGYANASVAIRGPAGVVAVLDAPFLLTASRFVQWVVGDIAAGRYNATLTVREYPGVVRSLGFEVVRYPSTAPGSAAAGIRPYVEQPALAESVLVLGALGAVSLLGAVAAARLVLPGYLTRRIAEERRKRAEARRPLAEYLREVLHARK